MGGARPETGATAAARKQTFASVEQPGDENLARKTATHRGRDRSTSITHQQQLSSRQKISQTVRPSSCVPLDAGASLWQEHRRRKGPRPRLPAMASLLRHRGVLQRARDVLTARVVGVRAPSRRATSPSTTSFLVFFLLARASDGAGGSSPSRPTPRRARGTPLPAPLDPRVARVATSRRVPPRRPVAVPSPMRAPPRAPPRVSFPRANSLARGLLVPPRLAAPPLTAPPPPPPHRRHRLSPRRSAARRATTATPSPCSWTAWRRTSPRA